MNQRGFLKLSNELKAGIVVLAGISALILGFSYLKSTSLFGSSKKLYAVYENVGGLQTGTTVSLNGYVVGTVDAIDFLKPEGNLLVTFTLLTDYSFSKNSVAQLYDTSVLGGKGLQIIVANDDGRPVQSGDTLPSSIQVGMLDKVQTILDPLEQKVSQALIETEILVRGLNEVLDGETQQNLRNTLKQFSETATSLNQSTKVFNELLRTNASSIDTALQNTAKLTQNLSRATAELDGATVASSITHLNASLGSLDTLLKQINSGEGTLGLLATDDGLYTALQANLKQTELLLQDLRLNPKRYLSVSVFGKKQKDYELPENDPALNSEKN
jgi:phospholipid/cholesterol/gamma-HCH transport system substrate-binding protein